MLLIYLLSYQRTAELQEFAHGDVSGLAMELLQSNSIYWSCNPRRAHERSSRIVGESLDD